MFIWNIWRVGQKSVTFRKHSDTQDNGQQWTDRDRLIDVWCQTTTDAFKEHWPDQGRSFVGYRNRDANFTRNVKGDRHNYFFSSKRKGFSGYRLVTLFLFMVPPIGRKEQMDNWARLELGENIIEWYNELNQGRAL